MFGRALECIEQLLRKSNFNQRDNKTKYDGLISVLLQFYDRIDQNTLVWPYFQMIFRQLPVAIVDLITTTRDWKNMTNDQFVKALSVRCDLLLHSAIEKSFSWINTVIDNVSNNEM